MPRTLTAITLFALAAAVPVEGRVVSAGDFTKRRRPVFRGQFGIAADPNVVKDGSTYRMCYTCPDPERGRAAICVATSRRGTRWRPSRGARNTRARGLVLRGDDGAWDENTETCGLVPGDDEVMYYAGYPKGRPNAIGAALGVARLGPDGTFVPAVNSVLEPTPGGFDSDGIYSPAVLHEGNVWSIVYAGHCYQDCTAGSGVFLLGATSVDGLVWTKRDAPVLSPLPNLQWMRDGVAEPALIRGDDGAYYLLFTGLRGYSRVIGAARGPSPFGPWTVNPDPVLVPTAEFERAGVLAPSALLDGDILRVWYLATRYRRATSTLRYAIGYATGHTESLVPAAAR